MKSYIVIHHSVSADNPVLSNIGAIRDWHVKVNGWRDIGYHWVLEQMNGRWEVVMGRLPDEKGAHTKELDLNETGYGICVVGNYDVEVPTEGLLTALRRLCIYLMRKDHIPVYRVIGHWEAQAMGGVPVAERKTCPGRLFHMDKFRESLENAIP